MHIVRFGSYVLPSEQLDMAESGGLERRGSTQAVAGYGGSLDAFGAGPDPLAEDTISKSFILAAASQSALQTAIDDLLGVMMTSQQDWRQGARLLVAQLPDSSQRATWAKCAAVRWNQQYFHFQNYWLGAVDISWRRSYPVWWNWNAMLVCGDHHRLSDTTAAGYTLGQGVSEVSLTAASVLLTITNPGNQRVTQGVLAVIGAATDPLVVNTRNQHRLAYSGAIAAGERLTLRLASLDARKNGVRGEWSNFTVGSEGGQLLPMALEPGLNTLTITCAGLPAGTFRYYWSPTWS
jgi:hypothetical protein